MAGFIRLERGRGRVAALIALVLTLVSGLAWADGGGTGAAIRPAEPPPPDFAAAQYIDSHGCVFLREGDKWLPRQARDGSMICGYPPTLSARRTAPETLRPLTPQPEEPAQARITRELSETVFAGLQTGELQPVAKGAAAHGAEVPPPPPLTDPAHPPVAAPHAEATAVPAPSQPKGHDDPIADLSQTIASAPKVRAAMVSPAARTDRLCALLGADQRTGASGKPLGSDPTLGFCQLEPLPLAALGHRARTEAQTAVVATDTTAVTPPDPVAAQPDTSKAAQPARVAAAAGQTTPAKAASSARGTAKSATAAQAAPAKTAPRAAEGLVQPWHRYVQIGSYSQPANARAAEQRVAAMGLPVRRSPAGGRRPVEVIVAGPLSGREAVVKALAAAKGAGFHDAFPR